METIKIDSSSSIWNAKDFINGYGLRSYNLWKLSKFSEALGYKVPISFLINSNLSIELSKYFNGLNVQSDQSLNYLQPDNMIFQCYYQYLVNNKKELIEFAKTVNNGIAPIIRGTSCAEGYKNLSFAGVCHSFIPKSNLSFEDNLFNGTAKVLSSIHSPYAKYYFDSHDVPEIGKNIGIIMMEMLKNPIFHVTAHVYPSEIRIKYFFTPQTGTHYQGGGDIIVDFQNEKTLLKSEFGQYEKIWTHTIHVLRQLSPVIYSDDFPIDVEFLITKNNQGLDLNIVQIRQVSDVHFKNHEMSNSFLPMIVNNSLKSIAIGNSYLYHSVIDCFGNIIVSDKYIDECLSKLIPIFLVKHQQGEGLFSFLDSLPEVITKKIGLIVTHPPERFHDHLQYSVYEDERIEFVIHVNENLTSNLKNGNIVHMISNGNMAIIEEAEELLIDDIKINFINETSLPDINTINAVFLVGFINNKIIATKNERGWDIPGGSVEPTDFDLISALKREADEESGSIIGKVKPFAVMQFEDRKTAMLFYASNDCQLADFAPKPDSLEREVMTIPEFITKYNWRKDIMELLIKRAIFVLEN